MAAAGQALGLAAPGMILVSEKIAIDTVVQKMSTFLL